ncbi:MAG: prepilin peptidase [Phycisphaeraceae bacterium]|nr:MAG: prepilin peptidase [Phycisphaeraceae bacterium]
MVTDPEPKQTESLEAPPPPASEPSVQPSPPNTGRVVSYWVLALCISAVIASAIQILTATRDSGYFIPVFVTVICAAAAFIDAATRRIPNVLTYPAILFGFAINVFLVPLLTTTGPEYATVWINSPGWRDAVYGFALAAMIGIPSFILRGLGGGDVKLLGAVAVLIGFETFLGVFLNTLLFAAAIGLVNWALKGELVARAQILAGNLIAVVVTRSSLERVYPFKKTEAPFGVALLLGLVSEHFFAVHKVLLAVNL